MRHVAAIQKEKETSRHGEGKPLKLKWNDVFSATRILWKTAEKRSLCSIWTRPHAMCRWEIFVWKPKVQSVKQHFFESSFSGRLDKDKTLWIALCIALAADCLSRLETARCTACQVILWCSSICLWTPSPPPKKTWCLGSSHNFEQLQFHPQFFCSLNCIFSISEYIFCAVLIRFWWILWPPKNTVKKYAVLCTSPCWFYTQLWVQQDAKNVAEHSSFPVE